MTNPTILTIDDDPMVSQAITRDLRAKYGSDYRIVRAASGAEALDVLAELALRDRAVALIATDQRMPDMTGIEMLDQARSHAPDAKFLLLTAYADTDVAIKAINDIGLDYYLLKPWDPPAERLYPVIDDLLGDWQRRTRKTPETCGWSGTAGRSGATRSRPSSRATTCPIARSTSIGTTRPSGSKGSRTPGSTISRWYSCPTARSSGPRRRSTSPGLSACAPAPSNRSTTCASSAAVPRASPPTMHRS